MDLKKSMWVVWGFSLAGTLFSGYLTYSEVFKKVCALGNCVYLGSMPSCFYGFLMYCALLGTASYALYSNRKRN